MNRNALRRLGPAANLLDALPSCRSEARKFLADRHPIPHEILNCLFERADRPSAVPIQFMRLMSSEERIVLKAEIRERASDQAGSAQLEFDLLLELQRNSVRNYFRLLRAQQEFDSRFQPSHRGVGALVTEELDKDRMRIARELHAGAGQILAGIKLNVDLIRSILTGPPETVQTSLERIQALADEALNQLRGIAQRLHPPDWQRIGIRDALQTLWRNTGIADRFHATLDLELLTAEPPPPIRIALYRAAQEGLSNVLRHSQARKVNMKLEQVGSRVHLRIDDDGIGFDTAEKPGTATVWKGGIGLRATRDQAHLLGGEFELTSGPGGTVFGVWLPLKEPQS